MKDGPMNEPTKREVDWETWLDRLYDVRMEPDKLLIMITNRRGQRAIRAASAQSAEPQEADFAPAVDPITGAPFFMWIEHPERGMVPTYGRPFDSYTLCERDIDESNSDVRFYRERFDHDEGAWVDGCESVGFSLITQDRLISLEDSLARLASKPSRSEAEAILQDVYDAGLRQGKWLVQNTAPNAPIYIQPSMDSVIEQALDTLAARPSREEEMREQIERIKHDCENALRSSTHHKCDYLSLIQSINDRLARAALAQGGARDEAQGK